MLVNEVAVEVLVVDDEVYIAEEILETLEALQLTGHVSNGVDAALSILERHPNIRVVITDLKMPQKTGVDLIKLANKRWPNRLRYIVMSGHVQVPDLISLPEESVDGWRDMPGVSAFLRKPIAIREIENKVQTTIECLSKDLQLSEISSKA